MDILNLPGFDVLERTEGHDEYEIKIRYTIKPNTCPHCRRMFPRLHGFGCSRPQGYRDLPIHGKKVLLLLVRARYKCLECGRTFFESVPHMDDTRQATARFIAYVERKALSRTFTDLAEELGVDEKTIRNIFADYVTRVEKSFTFVTPEWLGIDEVHLLGTARGVLTNVKERTIYDMLVDRKKTTVAKRLMQIKDRERIELVAMDMWQPSRDVVRALLPGAIIVIDKFHVVRMANGALEQVRKGIRASLVPAQRKQLMHDRFILLRRNKDLADDKRLILAVWLDRFPDLRAAYELKEDFYAIWDNALYEEEAREMYEKWKAKIPTNLDWAFEELTTALGNWGTEIFAYFDHRITNAYPAARHGLTEIANRTARGYSFRVLRAKMLFGTPHKRPKPAKPMDMEKRLEKHYPGRRERLEHDEIWTGAYRATLREDSDTLGADLDQLNSSLDSPGLVPGVSTTTTDDDDCSDSCVSTTES